MSRILIEQSEGHITSWTELDDDVQVLFVDYEEMRDRIKSDDLEWVRNIRNTAIDWECEDVYKEIDRIIEEEADWIFGPILCNHDFMAGQGCVLPKGHEGSHR